MKTRLLRKLRKGLFIKRNDKVEKGYPYYVYNMEKESIKFLNNYSSFKNALCLVHSKMIEKCARLEKRRRVTAKKKLRLANEEFYKSRIYP